MINREKHIAIVGAGLVGSLTAIYLAKRGYRVSLLERRGDMRKQAVGGGRSINLALSNRGIKALNEVGLADKQFCLCPTKGGSLSFDNNIRKALIIILGKL